MSTETTKPLDINKYKEIALKIATHFKGIISNQEITLESSKQITKSQEYNMYISSDDRTDCKKYLSKASNS